MFGVNEMRATLSPAVFKKVTAAIDALVSGDCKKITEAAEKVGLARESLSRALNKPHIAEFLRQKVIRSLAMAQRKPERPTRPSASANELPREYRSFVAVTNYRER